MQVYVPFKDDDVREVREKVPLLHSSFFFGRGLFFLYCIVGGYPFDPSPVQHIVVQTSEFVPARTSFVPPPSIVMGIFITIDVLINKR